MPKSKKASAGPKVDGYQLVTDRITALLKAGTVPWRRPWTGVGDGEQRNLKSKRAYRGINQLLLMCSGFDSPWWLSFKQAKELGAEIPKGTVTTPVVFWKVIERTVEPGTPKSRKRPDGSWCTSAMFLRYYRVFNTDQLVMPDGSVPEPVQHAEPANMRAMDVCKRYGEDGGPAFSHGGDRAYYSPARDAVRMPIVAAFNTEDAYWSTRFHELTHSTGHASRLAREEIMGVDSTFGSEPYAMEELVAEMGAAMLAATVGIDTTMEASAAYIANWLAVFDNDPKFVVNAAARAQRAVDMIRGTVFEDRSAPVAEQAA
ncbi:zincin-like metallopeptidase domain-containing protein [Mycobacterium sp.]|uniref:ArdC family protein n=1 Tax=Mycobacterium sp. TaxID=1785 RepID=UPI002635CDDC|nr:zincin-like metallopeptidase domain-containing protein [Mycobacterium sp.]